VNSDTGAKQRLALLQQDAERNILGPLRTHGWVAEVERIVEAGEYLIISAERGGQSHRIGLLYTSATDNRVYKTLANQVEHVFFNGASYMVESFAHGLDKPVGSSGDFHALLLQWNAASTDGKFVAGDLSEPTPSIRSQSRTLLSDQPIDAVWLRLRQFQSVTLAKRLVVERARSDGIELDDAVIKTKAEGLAYALRNATDYYQAREVRNVSQRVLNLYYGSLSFAFAEMLALPKGPDTLSEIENSTKQGHGLYTIDQIEGSLEHLVVGIIRSGFFPAWMRAIGVPAGDIPERKPRQPKDLENLPSDSWISLEQLFASIPELSDLFHDIFESKPRWVRPTYDNEANASQSIFGEGPPATSSYSIFVDDSGRLTKEDIAEFPGPITQIMPLASPNSARHFRVAVDHTGKEYWWQALDLHDSPFERGALILPILGAVGEYRAICVVLLYALSIVVRYRPGIWRRVQEGDLDHMRVLIEAFLAVVERVLPEQFLEKITGQRIFAKQPGSFV